MPPAPLEEARPEPVDEDDDGGANPWPLAVPEQVGEDPGQHRGQGRLAVPRDDGDETGHAPTTVERVRANSIASASASGPSASALIRSAMSSADTVPS